MSGWTRVGTAFMLNVIFSVPILLLSVIVSDYTTGQLTPSYYKAKWLIIDQWAQFGHHWIIALVAAGILGALLNAIINGALRDSEKIHLSKSQFLIKGVPIGITFACVYWFVLGSSEINAYFPTEESSIINYLTSPFLHFMYWTASLPQAIPFVIIAGSCFGILNSGLVMLFNKTLEAR